MSCISGKEFLKQDKELKRLLEQIKKDVQNISQNYLVKPNNKQNRETFKNALNDYLVDLFSDNFITFELEENEERKDVFLVPYYKGKKIESYKEVDLGTAIKECIKTDNNIIFKDDIEIFEVGINKSNKGTIWLRKPNESDEKLRNRIKTYN
ncbi:hypothetical protein FC976_13080 [Clostridium sporogenes]|uniref:hypothetical protein n=1 Tax=Clostridium sporogenes TaxID=1509 RepID=UPI0013D0102F|nr:hypothetical protein [Clostridium sporogenes]NFH48128.1 hypothetical protein [Clostridium sporogenes]